MISSKNEQLDSPIFASKAAKDLLMLPEKGYEKISKTTKNSEIELLVWDIGRIIKHGLIGNIGTSKIAEISKAVEVIILEKKQLTKEAKYLIDFMLAISLDDTPHILKKNEEKLLEILNLLKNDDKNFDWFYKRIISHLSESQFSKIQEAYSDSNSEAQGTDFESKRKVITGIIKLFNGNPGRILDRKDSSSFLGLDNSAKEAVCWRELEFKRSGNDDFARLAGIIAWRNWLFKEPILKEFCLKNDYEYDKLNFIQKADFTKQATDYFSISEMNKILNEATENELNRRKKSLEIETNPKFKNKRVSLGIELEMSGSSFELAIIYAWYENLDRSLVGDEVAFNKEIEKLFKQLRQFKDRKKEADVLELNSDAADQVAVKFKDDLSIEEQAELREKVELIISGLPDKNLVKQFKLWLKKNPINSDILELIQKYCRNKFNEASSSFSELRAKFYSLLTKKQDGYHNEYSVQSARFAKILPLDYPDISRKLLDIFKHHMGQVQALGHRLGEDAYGEYSLAYTSGNFKNPYRVNLRETWELAKTAFHNLDVNSRPMHVTIGWKEDVNERKINISRELCYSESSLLNFALMSTGWANRNFIDRFREKNESKLADKGETAAINSYFDAGKNEPVINRIDGHFLYGVEFRGFSPAPGVDQARLFSALGNLGTAMKAYIVLESKDNENIKVDTVDKELHEIWKIFRNKVKIIHSDYGDFPDLFHASAWESHGYSEGLTNFYLKISGDLYKNEGLVADMRKLIQETIVEIDQVFNEKGKVKKGISLSELLSRIGFVK